MERGMGPAGADSAPDFGRKVLLIWLALCAVSLAVNARSIIDIRFPDPDDLLRLLQVRDWIGGQSWFDVHQYRINPPDGAAMHWTRLIDPPIAAIILILRPLIGQHLAEIAAMTIVPLLTLGCVVALVARFARRMFGSKAAIFACLALALSVPVLHQLRPMRIDHHGWQVVMALIALNAAFARDPRKGGAITGLALAFWLAISIEGLPLTAAIMGLFALRWLRDWRDSAWLSYGMGSLALSALALWFIGHRPAELWQQYCDVVSGAHLALLSVSAAGCWLATRLVQPRPWQQIGALAAAGGAGIVALVLLAPQCARGDAFAALDPVVRAFWYLRVYEGLPVWYQPLPEAVQIFALPALGLCCLYGRWRSADTATRWAWAEYGLLIVAALAVAIMVERASAVAAVIAAPAAAALVRLWLDRAGEIRSVIARLVVMSAALVTLVPAFPVRAMMGVVAPQQIALERQVKVNSKCELAANLRGVNALPPADILSTLDTGPALLYAGHHRIVASGHHRSSAAMRDVIDAFRGDPAQALGIVKRRGIDYVAYCPGLFEPMIYQAEAPNGLMARLIRGEEPDWLEPVALQDVNGLKVYRVRQPGRNSSASPLMQ